MGYIEQSGEQTALASVQIPDEDSSLLPVKFTPEQLALFCSIAQSTSAATVFERKLNGKFDPGFYTGILFFVAAEACKNRKDKLNGITMILDNTPGEVWRMLTEESDSILRATKALRAVWDNWLSPQNISQIFNNDVRAVIRLADRGLSDLAELRRKDREARSRRNISQPPWAQCTGNPNGGGRCFGRSTYNKRKGITDDSINANMPQQ